MNRIDDAFAQKCVDIGKKLATKKLAKQLRELDAAHQEGDAYIKGLLPWKLIKENFDYYMVWKLTDLQINSHKPVAKGRKK